MLSGIKTGKKRKRKAASAAQPSNTPGAGNATTATATGGGVVVGNSSSGTNNRSAADALRMSLLSGVSRAAKSDTTHSTDTTSDAQARLDARMSSYKSNESALHNLQSRGRISNDTIKASSNDDDIVINSDGKPNESTIEYENEQKIRYNSRGKLSRHALEQLRQKTETEMTIEEMAAAERNTMGNNMDEIYARNISKMGKGFKKLEKAMGTNSRSGADEEDYLQETSTISNLYRSNDDKLSPAELAKRSQSRQIAQHDALSRWKAKSWWWMESPKFDKRYLIALGEKVSLVMTPTHKRLKQEVKQGVWEGGQCYIVPLSFSESFVGLDEEVWYEVKRFQSSLRQMFHKEGRGVIFLETVTRTSRGGSSGGLQAKMEVIPVPRSVERDAPLYFKSALAEVAQEWGTHGMKPIVLDTQKKKSLRNAVPKGFPYFYVGWEDGGFVQLIENEDDGDDEEDNGGGGGGGMRAGGGSKRFPRDFGIDTIGGMMDCDPIRFQRKTPAQDGDKGAILQFIDKWKAFDWTLELDG